MRLDNEFFSADLLALNYPLFQSSFWILILFILSFPNLVKQIFSWKEPKSELKILKISR